MKSSPLCYGIKMINAPFLWNQGYLGDDIIIAVLDTGCDYSHAALQSKIIGGANFTSDYDSNSKVYFDNNGHGTHVAGIVNATDLGYGVSGVAPNSKLLILKTLDKYGHGNIDSIINAINYCIKWRSNDNKKVRIISMSLGFDTDSEELHDVIKKAIDNDIIIVCSAGNNGDGDLQTIESQYPAIYQEVISVGAIDINNKIADFSDTNPQVDVVAPGVGIKSTFLNNSYATFSGTSMSTPYVAGVIALLINKYEIEYNRQLKYSEILDIFNKNTVPLRKKDKNSYRYIYISV